jgi:RimJ/RimL family protein N-acetyltransferase
MQLMPISTPELASLVAAWLAEKRNSQWLDFGNGVQSPSAASLRVMAQKDAHVLRVFTDDERAMPIGVVGLSNVDRHFKTATVWIALGEKRFSTKGYAIRAGVEILALGFAQFGLQAVNAWAVERNHASVRILERLKFRPVGRQRRCHTIDGQVYDRLWYDMLASEFERVEYRKALEHA